MEKRIELLAMYIQQLYKDNKKAVKNPNNIVLTSCFMKDLEELKKEIDKMKNV